MTSSRVLEGYVRALQGFLHIKSFLNCSFIAQKWCFVCKDILIFKLQFVQFIDMYSIVHARCMFEASKLLYATLDFVSDFLHMTTFLVQGAVRVDGSIHWNELRWDFHDIHGSLTIPSQLKHVHHASLAV